MRFVPKDRTLRIQACRGVFVSGFLMIEKYPKVALPENSLFLGKAPLCWMGQTYSPYLLRPRVLGLAVAAELC